MYDILQLWEEEQAENENKENEGQLYNPGTEA